MLVEFLVDWLSVSILVLYAYGMDIWVHTSGMVGENFKFLNFCHVISAIIFLKFKKRDDLHIF